MYALKGFIRTAFRRAWNKAFKLKISGLKPIDAYGVRTAPAELSLGPMIAVNGNPLTRGLKDAVFKICKELSSLTSGCGGRA